MNYMSTDGSNRSVKSAYCIRCRMYASLCLCKDLHPINTRTQVAIIMHETEQRRPSNTGYLATLMLPNSVLRIHGERRGMLDVHDWFEPTHRVFVLFPDAHARVIDRQLAKEDDRPIRLIVPDGTWRQARRMVRRVAGLAKIPRVALPEGLASTYACARGSRQVACAPLKRSAKPVPAGGSAPPRAPCSRAQPFRRAHPLAPGGAPSRKGYRRHLGERYSVSQRRQSWHSGRKLQSCEKRPRT